MTNDPSTALAAVIAAEEELSLIGATPKTRLALDNAIATFLRTVSAGSPCPRWYTRLQQAMLDDPRWTSAMVATWPHVPKVTAPENRPKPALGTVRWSAPAIAELWNGRLPDDPIATLNRLLGLEP
jgi:hypothetical protein